MPTPKSVRIRNYDVGFGDCFLLTFTYSDTDRRHVLIDFGSFPPPKRTFAGDMPAIARHVAAECGKDLRVVVATHRHADHISGFARRKKGDGSGDIIRACKPDLVIQPWTEHPDLDPQAEGLAGFAPADKQHVAALADVQRFLRGALDYAAAAPRGLSAVQRKELLFLGENGLRNKSAVENLMTMAKKKAGQKYVRFGSSAGMGKVLPGVKVRVLGPPTIEQLPEVEQQRREDTTEFWHLLAAGPPQPPKARGKGPFPRYAVGSIPGFASWLKRHADRLHRQQVLAIVRRMDEFLNNTSVILLFEVGNKKLLFPGDAQIENWSFALGKKDIQALLAAVDVYKVGHHGSLNATPKASLWAKFKKKGTGPNSLRTFMSTEGGHHGTPGRSEVPRRPLVDELKANSRLTTTDLKAEDRKPENGKVQREGKVTWVEETIRITGG